MDNLHVTLGGRYTHDVKSGDLYKVNNVASTFPFAFKYSRFDPLAIVAWDAADVDRFDRAGVDDGVQGIGAQHQEVRGRPAFRPTGRTRC